MSKTWGEIREEALRRCGQLPPKTNADRIRSMTDEELAEWLSEVAGWIAPYEGRVHPILEWLKAPVEGDNVCTD